MWNVSVIYHQFPHYRRAVLRELTKSDRFSFQFWGSTQATAGIVPFSGDERVIIHPLGFRVWCGLWLLSGYWAPVFNRTTDALIILANPNMPASWLIAIAARILRKKVLFWTHGWLKPEPLLKRLLRRCYYMLADHIMVYNNRSRELGIALDYPADRITTIYNSLDYDQSERLADALDSGETSITKPQFLFQFPERPLIICTARLTDLCRFDLLLRAAAQLRERNLAINILLVGEGPAEEGLRQLSAALHVDVYFYGACYDEAVLAGLIHSADLTVSPGKIGLTVIHSLSYGTPAITHGDMDEQMPEVEAIIPGVTGAFFERDNSSDLANVIRGWLEGGSDREKIRAACYAVVADSWNPSHQRACIERALSATIDP